MTLNELKSLSPAQPQANGGTLNLNQLNALPPSQPPAQTPIDKTGTKQEGFGQFVARDLAGVTNNAEAETLPRSIYQHTVGSKGITGAIQNTYKPVLSAIQANTSQTMSKSREGLIKIANEYIARANKETDPTKKKTLLQQANQTLRLQDSLREGQEENAKNTVQPKNFKEIIGTSINAATSLAPFASAGASGLNAGAKAVSNIDKIGSAVTNLLKGKTIVNEGINTALRTGGIRAATTAAQGTLIGAGQALSDNKGMGDVAKEAVTSGLISGGLSIGNSVAKYGIHKVAESLAQDLVNATVGPTKNREVAKQIMTKAKQELGLTDKDTFAQTYLKMGEINTKEGLLKDSILKTKALGEAMDTVLASPKGNVPINLSGLPRVDEVLNSAKPALGEKATIALTTLKNWLDTGATPSAREVVPVYRAIYGILPTKAWTEVNPALTPAKELLGPLAAALSQKVSSVVPEMAKHNLAYGLWSNVQTNVLGRLASKGLIGPLTEKIAEVGVLPMMFANPAAGLTLAGGIATKKLATSAPVKLSVAFALNNLKKLIESGDFPREIGETIKQLIQRGTQAKVAPKD